VQHAKAEGKDDQREHRRARQVLRVDMRMRDQTRIERHAENRNHALPVATGPQRVAEHGKQQQGHERCQPEMLRVKRIEPPQCRVEEVLRRAGQGHPDWPYLMRIAPQHRRKRK
jgi:hypothetical protein